MGVKLKYDDVKSFIDKYDTLISKEYISNKNLLEIKCGNCHLNFFQTYDRYKRGFRHNKCKNKTIKVVIKNNIKECLLCNNIFNAKRKNQQYCNKDCSIKKLNIDPKLNKECGRIGGNKSLQMFSRRSKAEIDFANLCINYFGSDNIICNQLIFKDNNNNYWDADIIIKHLKIAILYNGIFHYKKIYKDQKFERMLVKDRLKQQIIIQNGYTYYIIKDLNSYNKTFVINQFNLFIHKLSFNTVLYELQINKHKLLYINVLNSLCK